MPRLPWWTSRSVLAAQGVALTLASGCIEVARPWHGRVLAGDVGPVIDAPDVPPAPDDASALDAGPREDVVSVGPCGSPSVSANLLRAWAIVNEHALGATPLFRGCLEDAVASPVTIDFPEEVIDRLRTVQLRELRCVDDASTVVGGHDDVTVSARGMPLTLTVRAAAAQSLSAEQLAGVMVHHLMHHVGLEHLGTPEGEDPFGLAHQVQRCLVEALGGTSTVTARPVLRRGEMSVEGATHPFGNLRSANFGQAYLECPPGTWITGQGVTVRRGSTTMPDVYVTGIGIRCRPRGGGVAVDLGDTGLTWRDCRADEGVAGVVADATSAWIHSTRMLCAPWSLVADAQRPLTPLDLPREAQGWRVERRCPPGQAAYAVSYATSQSPRVVSLTVHCHNVDAPRPRAWVRLAAIGRASIEGTRGRRTFRCADHGVLTGFFGHRSGADSHLSRAGAVCQSTTTVGDEVRFRAGADGGALPESALPAVTSEGSFSTPERAFGAARCPAGSALVGISVRRSGRYGATRDILGLCAALRDWTGPSPPSPGPLPIVGDWSGSPEGVVETARCPAGHFLAGFEMSSATAMEGVVVDEIVPLCRDLRAAM